MDNQITHTAKTYALEKALNNIYKNKDFHVFTYTDKETTEVSFSAFFRPSWEDPDRVPITP